MDIYDENDNKITEDDVDKNKGYLTDDTRFVVHHEKVQAILREGYYKATQVLFRDGTCYNVTGEDDPHIKVLDDQWAEFEYVPQEGDEDKEVMSIPFTYVTTKEGSPAVEAYDEYEDILRYKLYTEEELQERTQQQLIDSLPDAMAELCESVSSNLDNVTVLTEAIAELSEIVSKLSEGSATE